MKHIFMEDCIGIVDELYLKKMIMEEAIEEILVDYIDLMFENEKLKKEVKNLKQSIKILAKMKIAGEL